MKVDVLIEGIRFGEAPRWRGDRLWFSDFQLAQVCSVSERADFRVEFGLDDAPSGLGWLPDGSLLVVSMAKRQLLRRNVAGEISIHADLSGVAGFHCNDMVVDARGGAYVGNFGFDLVGEIGKRGMDDVLAHHPLANLAYVRPDRSIHIAAEDMHFPNGSVIAADGRTLIVAETLGNCLTAFDVAQDGDLSNRRQWAHTGARSPDGITLDAQGAIWIANAFAPECVRIVEGGTVTDVLETVQPCYACELGGEDGRTLFMMTADTFVAPPPGALPTGRVRVAKVDVPRAR